MTRAHAARQLLALGPLTMRDFHAITGWPHRTARKVLAGMVECGRIAYVGTTQRGLYMVRAD